MMYQTLAPYYDLLVQDTEATNAWVSFVKQHSVGTTILELACGSGDVAIALANELYQVMASDISEDMIKIAKKKKGSEQVLWACLDMRSLTLDASFDSILCFCDSLNYILEETQLQSIFQNVYTHLNDKGVFLFDMHTIDRLEEFHEEYCENGYVDGHAYEWTIVSQDDCIYQNFVFYDEQAHPSLEQHIQKVYGPQTIRNMLETIGYQVEIYTDFTQLGMHPGEKYFFACRKEI